MLVSYRLIPIDHKTWMDQPPESSIRGFLSASITKDASSGSSLLESSSATVISSDVSYEFVPGWYRIEAVLKAGEDSPSTVLPLSTQWFEATGDTVDKGYCKVSLTGASVLSPLQDRKLFSGDYIHKGANAALKVAELIQDATNAPVTVSGSFTLDNHYVFDPGTSYLDIVWGVLRKASWCMRITPTGTIEVLPKPTAPKLTLDRSMSLRVKPGFTRSYDRMGIPNRIFVHDQWGNRITVENHQRESRRSYEKIGRWIDMVDTAPQQKDGESTLQYARRQLEEASKIVYQYSVERPKEGEDGLLLFDVARFSLPTEGLSGDVRLIRQQVDCGVHLKLAETYGYEVKEFVA